MSEPAIEELRQLVDEYRKALRDVEELYQSSAAECVRSHPDLIKGAATDFMDRMADLHRGLVIKIFVDIAHIDWKWKPSERLPAQALFEHVWWRIRRFESPSRRLTARPSSEQFGCRFSI